MEAKNPQEYNDIMLVICGQLSHKKRSDSVH